MIVLDLSASIEYGVLDRIYAALTQVDATRDRFGLIVFDASLAVLIPCALAARFLFGWLNDRYPPVNSPAP